MSGIRISVGLLLAAVVVVAGCANATAPPPALTRSATPGTTVSRTAAGPSPTSPHVTRTASPVTLATFAGSWIGHTRTLTVPTSGSAHEVVDDGCCTQEVDLSFRLSNPRGTGAAHATATATVTAVALYTLPGPAPKVGQTGTVSLVDGVLTVPFGGVTYCNKAAAARGSCGA